MFMRFSPLQRLSIISNQICGVRPWKCIYRAPIICTCTMCDLSKRIWNTVFLIAEILMSHISYSVHAVSRRARPSEPDRVMLLVLRRDVDARSVVERGKHRPPNVRRNCLKLEALALLEARYTVKDYMASANKAPLQTRNLPWWVTSDYFSDKGENT